MITTAPIRIDEQIEKLHEDAAGAWVWFAGTVRNRSYQKPVSYLQYEAFQPLAEKIMDELVQEAIARFHLLHASCVHRIGKVEIGDIAVFISTASAHRDAAYLANGYLIDTIKQKVPIWKKEYWEDGTYDWGGHHCGLNGFK